MDNPKNDEEINFEAKEELVIRRRPNKVKLFVISN